MSERFLTNPNFPEKLVATVFADIDDFALKKLFRILSIKVINPTGNPLLDAPVSKHADILANYVGKSTFLLDENQEELCNYIENNGGKSVIIKDIKSPYSNDCLLNFADIGDYIICNNFILNDEIKKHLPNKPIINVKQGYAKCSICICDHNTIITDDKSVYKAVLQYDDIKALLISKGSVRINKYDYGFIGGCSGLINNKSLLFNGNLSAHKDSDKIKKFLYDNGVGYIDIECKPLTDIGGIIPIMEKDGD